MATSSLTRKCMGGKTRLRASFLGQLRASPELINDPLRDGEIPRRNCPLQRPARHSVFSFEWACTRNDLTRLCCSFRRETKKDEVETDQTSVIAKGRLYR